MPDVILANMEEEIVTRFREKAEELLLTDPRMDWVHIQYMKEILDKAEKSYERLYPNQ